MKDIACIIVAVAHEGFSKITLATTKKLTGNNPILIDVRRVYDGEEATMKGFYYKTS